MILNNLELIKTELGNITVIINKIVKNNEVSYDGRLLHNDDIKIFIQTPTKETCIIGLKNAFELQMHFWLFKELSSLNIDLNE